MSISTKEKIIDASIELFSENGYAETSIRDIAKKVEIKTSSIYYHFESKESILTCILNEYMKVVSERRRQRRYEESGFMNADEAKISAKEIVNYAFFRFEGLHSARYGKMVKIMCSEATRNDSVRDYFRFQNNDSLIHVKSILDYLLKAGKLPACDSAKLAGILCAISFAFMHLYSIDMQSISGNEEETDMFSLLEYVLKLVVEGPDESNTG